MLLTTEQLCRHFGVLDVERRICSCCGRATLWRVPYGDVGRVFYVCAGCDTLR